MPLVRIDATHAHHDKLLAISDAIHEALCETFAFPPDDLFHIVQAHDGVTSLLRYGDYLDIHRDEGIVYVQVLLRAGHPASRKRVFYAHAARLAHDKADIEPRNGSVAVTV